MRLEDFDYGLPRELIAQTPSLKRDECRLMVLDRAKNTIEHRHFYDILEYLHEGDCLVVNDSRVIPARLYGIKERTGAHIELLLIKRLDGDKWESLVKPGKRLKEGDTVVLDENKLFKAHILDFKDKENGTRIIEFEYEGSDSKKSEVCRFHHTSNETQVMTIRRDIRPYIARWMGLWLLRRQVFILQMNYLRR